MEDRWEGLHIVWGGGRSRQAAAVGAHGACCAKIIELPNTAKEQVRSKNEAQPYHTYARGTYAMFCFSRHNIFCFSRHIFVFSRHILIFPAVSFAFVFPPYLFLPVRRYTKIQEDLLLHNHNHTRSKIFQARWRCTSSWRRWCGMMHDILWWWASCGNLSPSIAYLNNILLDLDIIRHSTISQVLVNSIIASISVLFASSQQISLLPKNNHEILTCSNYQPPCHCGSRRRRICIPTIVIACSSSFGMPSSTTSDAQQRRCWSIGHEFGRGRNWCREEDCG